LFSLAEETEQLWQLASIKMPTTLTSRPNKEKMELEEFLSDLGVRDPCEDKERLWPEAREPNKSLWPKLLAGLDPEAKSGFRSKMDNWRKSESPQILCIRGEDGTGKTTMVNALTENLVQDSLEIPETTPARLVEQLRRRTRSKPILVSYFFFQRNDVERNNVLAGLKGLIFRLINQSKDLFPKVNLLRHVPKYDDIGSSFFDGPTGLFVLRKILRNILQDEAISKVYLLLDALDNCSIGMAQLLDLIQDQSYKANWLVTTNRDHVVRDLGPPPVIVIDSKQNASNVSDLINSSLSELVDQKKLDLRCKETTRDFLLKKSGSSFLWITLALKELDLQLLKADSDDFRNLQSGLDPLYEKVMLKIAVKEEDQQLFDFLEEILHWVLLSYRPLHLKELHALITLNESEQGLSEALTLWTPLLITHKNIIYFMHQSTRDYLSSSSYSTSDYHWNIVAKCLELMKRYLRKDLLDPTSVEKQNEIKEVLNVIGYACCYWVDHIVEFLILDKKHEHLSDVSDGGQIHEFLRVYILHWLVALCMMKKGLDSIRMLTSLDSRLVSTPPGLSLLLP
jgi:GTPase SAR1 family protein